MGRPINGTNPQRMSYETGFDPEETTATEAILGAIAEVNNTSPLEFPPLYESIDADTLDRVVEYGPDATIQFTYNGYHVTVQGSGHIILKEHRKE